MSAFSCKWVFLLPLLPWSAQWVWRWYCEIDFIVGLIIPHNQRPRNNSVVATCRYAKEIAPRRASQTSAWLFVERSVALKLCDVLDATPSIVRCSIQKSRHEVWTLKKWKFFTIVSCRSQGHACLAKGWVRDLKWAICVPCSVYVFMHPMVPVKFPRNLTCGASTFWRSYGVSLITALNVRKWRGIRAAAQWERFKTCRNEPNILLQLNNEFPFVQSHTLVRFWDNTSITPSTERPTVKKRHLTSIFSYDFLQ
jgi:hypothetical protein